MKSLLVFLFSLCVGSVQGQNLEEVGVKKIVNKHLKKGIKFSGGLGFRHSYYQATGIENRFNPNAFIVNGNVTAKVYGLSIPVSFVYSNQDFAYKTPRPQPFNIIGLSPTYKGYTLHLGYRNMTFSKYTLGGHTFYGVGGEVKKGKWYIGGMGGRLNKAVAYDSLNSVFPVYKRMGYGLKIKYTNKGDEIALMSFYAKDDATSIEPFPETQGLYPMENHVYSLGLKKKLNDKITFRFEGARSALTLNNQDSSRVESGGGIGSSLFAVQQSGSTVYGTAFNAGLDLKVGKGKIGVEIERVDPTFRTLGTYFMNTDYQNITINGSSKFIKKKLSLSGKLGLQRDDLTGEKMTKMKRVVASVNASLKVSKKLSFNFGFSNFNSFINVKPVDQAFTQNSPYDNIDTLNYVQINKSVNGGINFKPLMSSNVIHTITLNGNYSVSTNESPGETVASSIYGSNAVYAIKMKKSGLSLGLNGNYNQNEYVAGTSVFAGVGARVSVPALKKKMKISLGARMTNNFEQKTLTAKLYAVTNNYSYKVTKHHSLSLNLRYSAREAITESNLSYFSETFDEFMANFGYNYRF